VSGALRRADPLFVWYIKHQAISPLMSARVAVFFCAASLAEDHPALILPAVAGEESRARPARHECRHG